MTVQESLFLPAGSRSPQAGVTLLEVVLAIGTFVVAALGTFSSILSSTRLLQVEKEYKMAANAARGIVEEIQETTFREIITTWVASNDDPEAYPGNTPYTFTVDNYEGLEGPMTGTVLFPNLNDEGQLIEYSYDYDESGHTSQNIRDLNGDGMIDYENTDHASDYTILPVTIRLSWRSLGEDRTVEFTTLLAPTRPGEVEGSNGTTEENGN